MLSELEEDELITLSKNLANSNKTFKKLHSIARGKVKTKPRGTLKHFHQSSEKNMIGSEFYVMRNSSPQGGKLRPKRLVVLRLIGLSFKIDRAVQVLPV